MTERPDDQPRTIDEIVAVLTSPAWAEELHGEEAFVEAMAAVILANRPEELTPMTSRSRPLKIGLLAGAVVLSLAGAAAAATGVLPARKPTQPPLPATTVVPDPRSTSTTTPPLDPTTTLITTTTAPSDQSTSLPDLPTTISAGAGTATAPPCPPDVKNHGEYVSGVAHETPPGPGHGKVVSAAARSDCGKTAAASPTVTTSGRVEPQANHGANGKNSAGKNGNGGKGHDH